jgi:hypothetical protein
MTLSRCPCMTWTRSDSGFYGYLHPILYYTKDVYYTNACKHMAIFVEDKACQIVLD